MGCYIKHTIKYHDKTWHLVFHSDSDYGADPNSQRSVSGYMLYLKHVPVVYKSKDQQKVTQVQKKNELLCQKL